MEKKTEYLRVDRATKQRLVDAGAKRGMSWGALGRELIFDGLEDGLRVETLARGFEGVREENENLQVARKDIAENIKQLSKLQYLAKLELVENVAARMQQDSGKLSEDVRKALLEVRTASKGKDMGLRQADMFIGGVVGFLVGVAGALLFQLI